MVIDKQKFILLLLVLYILTLNIKLFIVGSIVFLLLLLYFKKKNYLVLYLFVLYILSIYLYKKEHFQTAETNKTNLPTESTKMTTPTNKTEPTFTTLQKNLDEKDKLEQRKTINRALKTDVNKNHKLSAKDYSELFFVLNSLLEFEYFTKNKKNIDKVLIDYNIKNVFDLADKVINKEENPMYNNFLEKITCLDTTKNTINYLGCDNINYKKMFGFSEMLYVYCLSIEKIVELINDQNIYRLCALAEKRYILQDYDNQTSFGFELLGLEYYLNEKYINDKYYKIIEMLDLDLLLENKNRAISLKEKLYNYRDKNKRVVKDINSIIILFEYYNVFDKLRINYDDNEYNWDIGIFREIDLNKSYWDAISYFSDYNVKERIIKTINFLTKDSETINHEMNERYTRSQQTSPALENFNNYEHFQDSNNQRQLTQSDFEKQQKEANELRLKEYKIVNKLEYQANKVEEVNVLDMLSLDYIFKNFNKKFTLIILDLVDLTNRRCNVDCNDYERPILGKYIFFSKEILKILTKEERMFYVGLLLIFLAVLINFINMSK